MTDRNSTGKAAHIIASPVGKFETLCPKSEHKEEYLFLVSFALFCIAMLLDLFFVLFFSGFTNLFFPLSVLWKSSFIQF